MERSPRAARKHVVLELVMALEMNDRSDESSSPPPHGYLMMRSPLRREGARACGMQQRARHAGGGGVGVLRGGAGAGVRVPGHVVGAGGRAGGGGDGAGGGRRGGAGRVLAAVQPAEVEREEPRRNT